MGLRYFHNTLDVLDKTLSVHDNAIAALRASRLDLEHVMNKTEEEARRLFPWRTEEGDGEEKRTMFRGDKGWDR